VPGPTWCASTTRSCGACWRPIGGQENDTAGDGFFTTFDGPIRAVRCAQEIVQSLQSIGLAARAGIHTGECETADGKAAGIAVVVAARVMARAAGGQILVTST
jgi:class 3 adenylate cyclase